MVTRKSHYGWMLLGGLLCLFVLALLCKLRDGNRALAQSEPATPPAASQQPEPPEAATPPAAGLPATVSAPPPPPPTEGQKLPPISDKPEAKTPPAASVSSNAAMPPAAVDVPPPKPAKDHPGEPPLAPAPGEVVQYKVHSAGETFRSLARKTLGGSERWGDIHKLNPTIAGPDAAIPPGTVLRLPGDA